jgi:SAM-dependent methyltransferase
VTRFDSDYWEARWSDVLREQHALAAGRAPSAHLTAAAEHLPPGRALDAGCGHGTEALWLAARGWHVTAVDFSATALAHGRSRAEALGPDLAGRIDWVEGDLAVWAPAPESHDLVVSLYVHVAGSVDGMVRRLAAGVAPAGTLLLVGHRPVDPSTGAQTPAAGQVQVSVEEGLAPLEPERWEIAVAEDRPRAQAGSGVDAVICARRRS